VSIAIENRGPASLSDSIPNGPIHQKQSSSEMKSICKRNDDDDERRIPRKKYIRVFFFPLLLSVVDLVEFSLSLSLSTSSAMQQFKVAGIN
jgi:hypothetical protein